ncbi:hypothetical protein ACMZ6Y_00365 [Streptococcus pluranimalium]
MKKWSEEETEYLIYCLSDRSYDRKEIADFLGRSVKSVSDKIYHLRKTQGVTDSKHYSDFEIKVIKNSYHSLGAKELAKILGRSVKSMERKAMSLGVTRKNNKSDDVIKKLKKLSDEGYYINQICKKLGMSHTLVLYYDNKYNLSLRRISQKQRKELNKKLNDEFWRRLPVR